jgi:uncharacterized protein (TIGR03086 family)
MPAQPPRADALPADALPADAPPAETLPTEVPPTEVPPTGALPTEPLAQACASTRAVLARIRPGQLGDPTPCASWDVRALINHFVGTPSWAAAAVATGDGSAAPDRDYVSGDYLASYDAAVRTALDSFAAPGALDRAVVLPFGALPGAALLGILAQEQFTHGWDLARAAGQPTDLDPGLARELLARSEALITDDFRGPDGAAYFGPATQAPPGASAADRLAAFLGRPV